MTFWTSLRDMGWMQRERGWEGNKKGKNDIGFDNPIYIYIKLSKQEREKISGVVKSGRRVEDKEWVTHATIKIRKRRNKQSSREWATCRRQGVGHPCQGKGWV